MGTSFRLILESALRLFTPWLVMVIAVTWAGFPGVVCITPLAWLLALAVGVRIEAHSPSLEKRPRLSVIFGGVEFFNKQNGINTVNSEFSVEGVNALPRVDIFYGCADASADLIDFMVKAGAKGIVIAGVGDGNMNAPVLEAVKKATQQGVKVVRASRVPTGVVLIQGEVNDKDYGTVSSDQLKPQKARVLLMLALLKERSRDDLQKLFIEY